MLLMLTLGMTHTRRGRNILERSFYETLGVSYGANQVRIKEAYKKLVREYHPDKYANNPLAHLSEEMIKKINEAYEVLGDPEKRAKYDKLIFSKQVYKYADHQGHRDLIDSEPRRNQIACAYHKDVETDIVSSFCNKPLTNRQYQKNISGQLVETGIVSLAGLLLFCGNLVSALLLVALYIGWQVFT